MISLITILAIACGIILFNMALGTFVLAKIEPNINIEEAAYLHFTSFTGLGGPTPNTTNGKIYVIIDNIIGYFFIPVMTGLFSYKWFYSSMKSAVFKYLQANNIETASGAVDNMNELLKLLMTNPDITKADLTKILEDLKKEKGKK